MKSIHRRIFVITLCAICVFVSALFLTSFTTLQKTEPPVADHRDTAPATTDEGLGANKEEAPTTTPETGERLEIDHPLPPEPVAPVTIMASAHFTMAEYACDCDGYCDGFPSPMDPLLLEKVEALRCALGAPVVITSGVRCPERNAEVGGIQGSWHLSGHAADLYCPGISYTQVAAQARALGLGVMEYPGQQFDHVEIWR